MASLGHGQVWWADLDDDDDKIRPVVVLTRAVIAPRLRRVVVAPVTSTVRNIATEVPLGAGEGVRTGSVANLDNVQLLDVERLLGQAGAVPVERWPEFCAAMHRVMGCRRWSPPSASTYRTST